MNTELQLQDGALRLRVRERIKGGRLPAMSRASAFAGFFIHRQSPLLVFGAQTVGILVLLGSKS